MQLIETPRPALNPADSAQFPHEHVLRRELAEAWSTYCMTAPAALLKFPGNVSVK